MSGTELTGKRSKPMEDGVWDCSVCTYKNSAEAFKCEMCDVRKGTSTRKPKPNSQLVAQQVVQQMASVSKKQTSKRVSERVDIGSDTSQDSHRSETRDSDILGPKTSTALVATTSQQHHQLVNLPPSATFANVVMPSPHLVTGTSQPSGALGSSGDVNFVALGRHYHRCANPTVKAISPLRTNGGGSSGATLGSSGDDSEYISTPVTVKELTVIIHELVAPKVADRAPSSSLKVLNKTTKRKRASLESAGGQNTELDINAASADCNHPPPPKAKADWPTGDSDVVSTVPVTTNEATTDFLSVQQSQRPTPPSTPAFVPKTQLSPQLNDAPN